MEADSCCLVEGIDGRGPVSGFERHRRAHPQSTGSWGYGTGPLGLRQGVCLGRWGTLHQGSYGISHGSGGGYTGVIATSLKDIEYPNHISCISRWSHPVGYYAVKSQLDVYTNGKWAYCADRPWKYNDNRGLDDEKLHQEKWWHTPCGYGSYYTAWGSSYVYFDGSWRGGWQGAEGSHKLPT